MATQHVIAYFMHENERDAAEQAIGGAQTTDSFVMGDIDEADIPKLESQGLIVQVQPADPPPAQLDGQALALDTMIDGIGPMGTLPTGSGGGMDAGGDLDTFAIPQPIDYYAVWLRGPLLESARTDLQALGVTLSESRPDGSYTARLSTRQVTDVSALDFVMAVNWLSPVSSAPQILTRSVPMEGDGFPPGEEPLLTFDARLHDPVDKPAIMDLLTMAAITVVGTGTRKIRFLARENAPILNQLSGWADVSEYLPPVFFNNVARRLLGVDALQENAVAPLLLQDGANQIVAIADTGIDDQHPDFHGRILAKIARGRPNDATDPAGHGTHVAGSVLGDGTASNGQIKGVAPGATLFFQSLLDAAGKMTGLPVDLNDLFDEAYQAGARIHNDSWGSLTPSNYTANSEEVDEFVFNHKDMLIVVAAGNAGTSGQQPKKAASGFVDWLSIGSPATAKNALTVGASRSDRTDGAMSGLTWIDRWPTAFPMMPIAVELISGDPNCLAAFSSRGPCDDRRIKPDVVAPGTDILSTRSAIAPIANFWGPYPAKTEPKDPHYAFDGGTSMATPLVTGCAALVRQYYVEQAGHPNPSAALLKATLINSTTWLTGPDATAATAGTPNYHQGHGRVTVNLAVPNPSQPGMELRFKDEWATFQFVRTGQRKRYQFVLPVGIPDLRFCMAYTDAPARSLQNNINLIVQHVHNDTGLATKFMGNAGLPDALTLPDPDNNVETVRIQDAKAGTYFIQVFAANLLKPPQDFALVVTGVGVPPLLEI